MSEKNEHQGFSAFLGSSHNEKGDLIGFFVSTSYKKSHEWIDLENQKNSDHSLYESIELDEDVKKDKSKVKNDANEQSFSSIMENLVSSISSFYHSISATHFMRPIFLRASEKDLHDYRDENFDLLSEEGSGKIHGIPEQHVSVFHRRVKKLSQLQNGLKSLPESILMGLVASFDSQISGLIKYILLKKPSMLKAGERSIDVKEVLSFHNFDDLISDLVDRQIYDLMRGSHFDQVKYIEKNFSIEVGKHFDRWNRFLEVFERRNLAAHGEGVANLRYEKKCDEYKVAAEDRLKTGEALQLSPKYLRRSTDVLMEFGILLIWWIWLKHSREEIRDAYESIRDVTYDLIVEERYQLASRILESALSRKDEEAPEEIQRMMAINLANCYKKQEEENKCKAALKKFNWSASADNYKICVAVIEDDIDEVCNLMPKVVDRDAVGKQGFRDWPVFDWVRNNQQFREKFEELFGEPIESNSKEKTTESEPMQIGGRLDK